MELSMLGKNNTEIAEALGIDRTTLNHWEKNHVEIFHALRKGREDLLVGVVAAMGQKACGWKQRVTKSVKNPATGEWDEVERIVEHAPDVEAAKLLLGRYDPKWTAKPDTSQNTVNVQVNVRQAFLNLPELEGL